MTTEGRKAPDHSRLLAAAAALLIAIPALWLFGVAWRLTVDKYDAFDILLNTRSLFIAGDVIPHRPLGLSIFQSPLFAAEQWFGWDIAFRGCHLLSVLFYIALISFTFGLLRAFLSSRIAWFLAFLLAVNPLVAHSTPFGKEDIPAAAMCAGCFYFYLLAVRGAKWRHFALAGVFAGLALSLRQNLPPVLIGTLLICETVRYWRQRKIQSALSRKQKSKTHDPVDSDVVWLARGALLLVVPILILFLTPMIMYPLMGRSTVVEAPSILLADMMSHAAFFVHAAPEPLSRLVWYLWLGLTPPVAVLALAGLVAACARRRPGTLLFATWLGSLLFLHTFVISHREARFFLPVYPPIFFFTGCALEVLDERLTAMLLRTPRQWVWTIVFIFLAFLPAKAWLREWRRFRDPVYSVEYERSLSKTLRDRAGGDRHLIWLGIYYPLHPADYELADDDTECICHFSHNAIEFFNREDVLIVPPANLGGDIDALALRLPGLPSPLNHDGDVVLINREPDQYDARTLPATLKPLEICTMGVWVFGPSTTGRLVCRNPAKPPEYPRVLGEESNSTIHADHWPNGRYAAFITSADAREVKRVIVDVTSGQLDIPVRFAHGTALGEIALLYFYNRQTLPPPP